MSRRTRCGPFSNDTSWRCNGCKLDGFSGNRETCQTGNGSAVVAWPANGASSCRDQTMMLEKAESGTTVGFKVLAICLEDPRSDYSTVIW